MKLKYYMRGLGIGIILTTLILTIGRTKEKLSDDDIKDRAAALGMVMKEQSNPGLEKLLDEIKPTGLTDDNSPDLQQGEGDTQQGEGDTQQGDAGTQEGDADTQQVDADTQQGDAGSQQGDADIQGDNSSDTQELPLPTLPPQETVTGPIEIPSQTDSGQNDTEITFSVVEGMSSGKVAALLQEKGLIENADEFNAYIVEKGKASVIRIGNYSLPQDATFEEIINAITARP